MIPVDQSIVNHCPAEGRYGDCFRACIASILELPIAVVPHTMAYDETLVADPGQWFPALNAWLSPRGLTYMDLSLHSMTPDRYFRDLMPGNFSLWHVISGISPRGYRHAVVGHNGVVVHDPHPSRAGLIGPADEGWVVGLLMIGGDR